jgi:hypothetical protein
MKSVKLCDRCSSLGLSVDKFLIRDERPSDSKPSMRSLRLANERFALGTVAQIKNRAQRCRLCGLISRTLPNSSSPKTEDALCHLIWEIDGRIENFDDSIGEEVDAIKCTRRLRVVWNHTDLQQCESYLVLAAPSAYNNSDVDYRSLLNEDTEFLGRRLGKWENKRNLIRELLRLCERFHDDRCTRKLGIEDDFHNILKEPYFGVIDLENENLVPLPVDENYDRLIFESYAAVSYVWGDTAGREHTTKICNIQSRRKSGGLASVIRALPKALQDAIELIQALRIRYIWIDSLCIVQDSSHSWNLNARAMHLIYGNALFTICAADGNDANTGLLALDATHRPTQWIEECGGGLELLLHQPSEVNIGISRWNKRAWTFQERLLSKRCLIFAGGRIYFQCRSTAMSEDIFPDRDGRGWSLDLLHSPLQMLFQLKLRALWFYTRCVSLYTRRELSEPFDILSAFSGMCKHMEYTMHAPFVFGLPTSHFDFALLWQPKNKASRLLRPKRIGEAKYKDTKFPSWSWCGWESDGILYCPDMVGGCISDVHSWLLGRTWIDWHIRDGHGTLRRVWDGSSFQGDESTNIRWRGYEPCLTATPRPSVPSPSTFHPHQPQEKYGAKLIQRPSGKKGTIHHTPGETRNDFETTITRGMANTIHSKSAVPQQAMYRPPNDWSNAIPTDRSNTRYEAPPYNGDSEDSETSMIPSLRRSCDAYGRPHTEDVTIHMPKESFTLTLPEDPFHVMKTDTRTGAALSHEFPDQIYLQFFTWKTNFHIVPVDIESSSDSPSRSGLRRCHIMDRRGDKCGSILIDVEWLRQKQLMDDGHDEFSDLTESTEFEFIVISQAKNFTKDEFPDWSYYIPKEREESEWDLFFVLLVEHFPIEEFHRRVAIGKVFKTAFNMVDDEWQEIILG